MALYSLLCSIQQVMLLGGLIVFYLGQAKENSLKTFIGIFLMFVVFIVSFLIPNILDSVRYEIIYPVLADISGDNTINFFRFIRLFEVVLLLIPIHNLTKIRNLRESLLLHKTLREASQDINKIIQLLKSFVDRNWGNMNLRQKYIELLLFNGQIEEAIVEAKLALEVDPYNLGVTLLLANSYFDVGLYEESKQVCDYYLAISSYSFEFSNLKERCQLNMDK